MNDEKTKEAKSAGSSRLGKEAKIGVMMILALVLILGIVATIRFTRSTKSDAVATAELQPGEKQKPDKENTAEAFGRYGERKPRVDKEAKIVVPAPPASGRPPETKGRDADLWKFGAEKHEPKRELKHDDAGSSAQVSMPPPIPEPIEPRRHEYHDRDAADSSVGRTSEGVGQLHDAGSEVRLFSPETQSKTQSEASVGRADPSSYAVAESAPVPPHPQREHSRYDDIATQPQSSTGVGFGAPASTRVQSSTGVGFGAPASTGASYGANDYRNVSAEPAYRNRESGRSSVIVPHSSPAPPRDDGKYEVQPNDSYWTISERLYGTNAYFKALAAHNRDKGKSEETLRPGDLILAPTVAQLEQSYPDLCPKPGHREAQQSQSRAVTVGMSQQQFRGGRTYTVAEGDTLFNIARYELGKASRWAEIYELNRHVLGKDFNYLKPGIQLTLPEREKSDMLTRQTSNGYQR